MFQSIANRISLAALALTMAVVLIFGVASYLFSRNGIKQHVEEKLAVKASIVSHRISMRLEDFAADMEVMAKNLLVVNALADSEGRDMYLKPLLRGYRPSVNGWVRLALCDFSGNVLGANREHPQVSSYASKEVLDRVIEQERPLRRVISNREGALLFMAYPVFYNATGRAEGMVILEAPLEAIITGSLGEALLGSSLISLSSRNQVVWGASEEQASSEMVRTTVSLEDDREADDITSLGLVLSVAEPSAQAYAALNNLSAMYLATGAGVLLLAGLASRVIGRQLTSPLLSLTMAARQVAEQGVGDVVCSEGRDDEIAQLGTAFKVMLTRVDERTMELRREVRERSVAEEKASTYAETQKVLLQEVNHRVKNNLVAIISMLHQEEDLAQRTGKGEYVERLREVVWRVTGLLTVHRLLSSSSWAPLSLSRLCESVIQGALKGMPSGFSVRVHVSESPIHVDSDQAHCLAMVINELITNAMKYGGGGREQVSVFVSIALIGDGRVELVFRDDGPGFPAAILNGDSSAGGIGYHLLAGLVRQSLRGTLAMSNDQGAVARITFPEIRREPHS